MKQLSEKNLPEIVAKAKKALEEAVEAAVAEHWRNGRPVYVWRDEQVVALYPDGTAVPVEDDEEKTAG